MPLLLVRRLRPPAGCIRVLRPRGRKSVWCADFEERAKLLCKHAAQYILLASCRSTSSLLTLVRGGFVRRQLADMLVGTLASTIQNYKVRLQRANMRMLLCGRPYGFNSLFWLKLDQVWRRPDHLDQTAEDMVDCAMVFIRPFKRPTWRDMQWPPNLAS